MTLLELFSVSLMENGIQWILDVLMFPQHQLSEGLDTSGK
jgi:hypothetical protein